MSEELQVDEDARAFLLRVLATLPGMGRLPHPSGTGTIEAPARAVAEAVRKDMTSGLDPFDPAPVWRVLRSPVDSARRGFGRRGVGSDYCVASPLLVLATNSGGEPAGATEEPYGNVVVGPADSRVVLDQAKAAYTLALTGKKKRGSVLGLPGGGP